MESRLLTYDPLIWEEELPKPLNTLQLFITNKCNLRCNGCFYADKLDESFMPIEKYRTHISAYAPKIKKINLLGGEPTLYPYLSDALDFNRQNNLKTTLYTNGRCMNNLNGINLEQVSVRIGVHSVTRDKPLNKIERTSIPVSIVYMLTKDNVSELRTAAEIAANEFNCTGFYISSIRDIIISRDFWKDTSETLSIEDYCEVVQDFINGCPQGLKRLDISKRGLLYTQKNRSAPNYCRFANIFPDSVKVICPLDISTNVISPEIKFNERKCNKNSECVLTKIVLKRRH